MDENFLFLNKHLEGLERFLEEDKELAYLKQLPYTYTPLLLEHLPTATPGIYSLIGGKLTGKTTLLKQWMVKLLIDKNPPQTILYSSAEYFASYHALIQFLQNQLENKVSTTPRFVIIDDITEISGWEKAIKFAQDLGWLENVVLLLSSNNVTISKTLQSIFPTRQTIEEPIDFYLYPLSFHEFAALRYPNSPITEINLYELFNQYLLHGGYLHAINDFAKHGEIQEKTLKAYSDWLRKELQHYDKQETFLLEIIDVILRHYNKPITWNAITHELSINHPKTIGDYVALLEALHVTFVQYALLEKTLKKAPKKARKLIFTDPFIFHSMRAWINPVKNPFATQIKPALLNPELCADLVKACVTTHFSRLYPTYYIKAEGEIDLAYVEDGRFWPIVVTWSNQLNTKDLKQILKYPNAKILTKAGRSGIIEHIRTEPLPQALWRLEE